MEEKTEAVKSEETTVGLTMNYNPFSFISCQEDALVLAGCISHGLDADVIKKSGDLFATARAMLLDACVCLLYRQGGDSMSMQGLVDLLQNDISHNEDQDMPSINAVLSGRLDLACFCGDSSKYYSVLTRSTRQDGALQVTEIDRKGPIGHRLLTGPKQLELPGCGATVAAVSDISRCTEQEILDAVGFKMQQGLNSKAMKCKVSHHRLDDERLKIDLPKEGKSPTR